MNSPTADKRFEEQVRALRRRLARELPGRTAQEAMTTSRRPFVPIDEARATGCREAGTLVLVYPKAGKPHLVLTLRPDNLDEHGGQISLPGGRLELGESHVECALREAREELGLILGPEAVLGALTPLYISASGYLVSPVVAATSHRPGFAPDPAEVEDVLEVPLAALGPSHRRVDTWHIRGEDRQVPYFPAGNHKIWGATSMILSELSVVWREAAAEARG